MTEPFDRDEPRLHVRESWLFGLSPEQAEVKRKSIQETMRRNFAVMNRLDPHLGCVVCRSPLDDGRCPNHDQHQADYPREESND